MYTLKSKTFLLLFLFALCLTKNEVKKIFYETAEIRVLVKDKWFSQLILVNVGQETIDKNLLENLLKSFEKSKILISPAKKQELREELTERIYILKKRSNSEEKSEENKVI